jgi:hypothetical protein
MKIGIMQPYFFPYIGYFQLINAVDIYVNLDHVAFMKRSYMTRNTLKNNIPINIDVLGGSQNKKCNEVEVLADGKWFNKFYKTLELNYKKEPYYNNIMSQIIDPWRQNTFTNISEFNFTSIHYICQYLDIQAQFFSSQGITDQPKNKGLQDITKYFEGTTYINAIGGQKLYNKKDFASQGIDLKFIQMEGLEVDNKYVSILDLLFRYSKEYLKEQLNKFKLI